MPLIIHKAADSNLGHHANVFNLDETGRMRTVNRVRASGCSGVCLRRNLVDFVDLLLTCGWERKKPPLRAGRKQLIRIEYFGCGDRI